MKNIDASLKELTELRLEGYSFIAGKDVMETLYRYTSDNQPEIDQIQEMTDWIIDMCSGLEPTDEECLRFLKHLRNLRSAFECLRQINVRKDIDGAVRQQ